MKPKSIIFQMAVVVFSTFLLIFPYSCKKGDTGPQGPKGDTGAIGAQGVQGIAGADGAMFYIGNGEPRYHNPKNRRYLPG